MMLADRNLLKADRSLLRADRSLRAGRVLRAERAIGWTMLIELFRRKDLYVLGLLVLVLIGSAAAIDFFGVEGAEVYLRELATTLSLLFTVVIAVAVVSRQIPREVERKTIVPILAKPITRWQFLFGKFLGATACFTTALVVFWACGALVSAAKGVAFPALAVQAVVLQWLGIVMLTAMALFFSTLVSETPVSVTLSLLSYFLLKGFTSNIHILGSRASGLGAWGLGMLYTLVPHFEFYDTTQMMAFAPMQNALGPVDWLFFAGYALAYTAVFLVGAWLAFRRKRF
jgi:ABC-type transport system involved in multi-copper enzyme maturation permease subunit